MLYFTLLVSRRRKMRAIERARRAAWDRAVSKMYGNWASF